MNEERVLSDRTKVPVIAISQLSLSLPFFHSVSAGFPSPADDYTEERLNLDQYLIKNPTADSFVLVREACRIARALYERGTNYKKAGILASNLITEGMIQGSLFGNSDPTTIAGHSKLFACVDALNKKYGRHTVYLASCGRKSNRPEYRRQEWSLKQQYKSPAYTTRWGEILKVR